MTILVDTNILLDCLQERKPHYASAMKVWQLVENGELHGFVSAISFNNIYYIARRQVGNERALDAVRLVRRTFEIVPLDEAIIDQAIAMSVGDFEDAIEAAAAIRIDAELLVTRNARDFRVLGMTCASADELLAIIQP